MTRPAGYLIDVPVTLTVAVRGAKSLAEAKSIARGLADTLSPSEWFLKGHNDARQDGVEITEASLESTNEESCEVLDHLEAEE